MIVGSTYFFKDIKGFSSKDVDNLILEENPTNYKDWSQLTGHGKCIFRWRKVDADEMVSLHLKYGDPMSVGKFLVKDFVEELQIKKEHLIALKDLFEKLDDKHKYLQILYDYSINNDGSVDYPEDILKKSYFVYLKYRK